MEDYTQQETAGKVHTAELMLLETEGADTAKDYSRDSRITGAAKKGRYRWEDVCYLRFNPNDLKVWSSQTSRYIPVGACESLADFRLHVRDWAETEAVPLDAISFSRVDFAVDYCIPEGSESFRQMCDMLILAFNIKHNTAEKEQYYGETQTTMQHKNNRSKAGQFEIECYRKCVQQRGSGVQWRLEIRFIQNKKRQRRKQYKDILPMIAELRTELNSLPDYYNQAQLSMDETLIRKYREELEGAGGTVILNDFIYLNRDRIFSRQQLAHLFASLGSKNVPNAVKNYAKRKKAHRFITKKDFERFVKCLDDGVDKWVKNDPFLLDFFSNRNV